MTGDNDEERPNERELVRASQFGRSPSREGTADEFYAWLAGKQIVDAG